MIPPRDAWHKSDKARPVIDPLKIEPHTRIRHDKVDKSARFTLRHNGKLHHIGMGRKNIGKRLIVLIANLDIRVLDVEGKLLRHLTLDTSKDYQPLNPPTG